MARPAHQSATAPLPRAIIFDCDGTVLDSVASHRFFFGEIKKTLGLPPLTEAEDAFGFIHTVEETLNHIVPPKLLPQARRLVAWYDWSRLTSRLRVEPGLIELMDLLTRTMIRRALNTNGGAEARLFLTSLGLAGYFEEVVTADDVDRPKPNPEGVGLILKRFGLAPAQVWYIGDSVIDRDTAAAAGVVFVAFGQSGLTEAPPLSGWPELTAWLAGRLQAD